MSSNQISREEQLEKTRERMYEVYGLQNGGIIASIKTIWYLTAGYFTDYKKHLLYVNTLNFILKKQKEEKEKEEEKEDSR